MIKINLLKPKWNGTVMALKNWELLAKWHDVGRTLPRGLKFAYDGKIMEFKPTLSKITELQQPGMMWCGYAGKLCDGKCTAKDCPFKQLAIENTKIAKLTDLTSIDF